MILRAAQGVSVLHVQPPERPSSALLQRAIARWEVELSDLAGHDDLVYLDPSSGRLLDLSVAHPSGLAGFLAGRLTRLSDLFRAPESLYVARVRARAVSLAASRLEDTYGLPGAHLATGTFDWPDAPGGRPVRAPILLRPVRLVARGAGAGVDYDLDPADEARLNPALVELLRAEGIVVDDRPVTDADHGVAARKVLDRITSAVVGLDVKLNDRILVGVFADIAPGMLTTLRAQAPDLGVHRTIQAVLRRPSTVGQSSARHAPASTAGIDAAVVPESVERQSVSEKSGPAQADGDRSGLKWHVANQAQRPATQAQPAALAGQPTGPARRGARAALLDPAQLAVLDAVESGLDTRVEAAVGSGVTATAAAIVEAVLGKGNRLLVVAPALDELEELAARLKGDVGEAARGATEAAAAHARLHRVHPTWGLSRMQAMERLVSLGAPATAAPAAGRLSALTLVSLSHDRSRAATLLGQASKVGVFTPVAVNSPWAGAALPDDEATRRARAVVEQLLHHDLPTARTIMSGVAAAVALPEGLSLTEWTAQVEVLTSVRGTLDLMLPEVYQRAGEEMVKGTASSNWRATNNVTMSMLERRRWRREASALVRPGLQAADLHATLLRARLEKDLWARLGGAGKPGVAADLDAATAAVAKVRDCVTRLDPVLAGSAVGAGLADLSLQELTERLQALSAAGSDLHDLPARARLAEELSNLGLDPLVEQLRAEPSRRPVWESLEIAWLRGVLAELEATPDPIGVAAAEAPVGFGVNLGGLTTATSLGLGRLDPAARFDVVLLLDANRIGLAEAVLAIARGDQSVLIGDPAGLAPAGLDLGDQSEVGPRRVSVLAATDRRLATFRLDRVHRQPAALAALVPQVGGTSSVVPAWSVASAEAFEPDAEALSAVTGEVEISLEHVPGSTVPLSDNEADLVPAQEVEAVVALIAEHARSRPGESLAVLTVSRPMAHDVADVLRQALRRSPELAGWLTSGPAERFVVTDLLRSDEVVRDHVVLALGLARDPHGRFGHRFGVLDTEAGAGLIGLGVGRARRRLTVVSGIWAEDIEAEQLGTAGGRRVHRLLQVASGAARVREVAQPPATPDPVLGMLVSELEAQGYPARLTSRPDREPDLALVIGGRRVAVLWDGNPDPALGVRGTLAAALTRFGWTVRRIRAEDVADNPKRVAAQITRRPA